MAPLFLAVLNAVTNSKVSIKSLYLRPFAKNETFN